MSLVVVVSARLAGLSAQAGPIPAPMKAKKAEVINMLLQRRFMDK